MADGSSPCYLANLRDEISQGDVFNNVPLVYLKTAAVVVKPTSLPGGRQGYERDNQFDPGQPDCKRSDRQVVANCDVTRAILLTHDCEVDKPGAKLVQVALVRLFPTAWTPTETILVRENRKLAFYHLPGVSPGEPECYVDFRRLCTISAEVLRTASTIRVCSLSDDARLGMMGQFFRYLTRLDLLTNARPVEADD